MCVCACALRPLSSESTADLSLKFLQVMAFKTVVIFFFAVNDRNMAALRP